MMMVITMTTNIRTYSELCKLKTFRERYEYLRLRGKVGEETFGWDRYLNQRFYQTSDEWKSIRREVIIRDLGCDLGMEGYEIQGKKIIIHHMNPIAARDILDATEILLDPEFLICTTHQTHNAIHYGDSHLLVAEPVVRTRNDTCPWKRN